MEIFTRRWDEIALHPFVLQTQHHNHISPIQCGIEIAERNGAKSLDAAWHQGRGRDNADFCAQRFEAKQVRSGNAAVQNIADNRHAKVGQRAFVLLDGKGVQQRLSRVAMAAIAGVNHRRMGQMLGGKAGRATG